jgi:hypothetical protein
MFNLKKSQILKHEDKTKDYFTLSAGSDFPVNRYISQTYGEFPCAFYLDDTYNEEVFDFLMQKAKMISFSSTGKVKYISKNQKAFRGGTFWFYYKDIYVKLSAKGQEDEMEMMTSFGTPIAFETSKEEFERKNHKPTVKTFDIAIFAPASVQDFHFQDFEKFIVTETGSKVHLFIKDQYNEYSFQPINVTVPEDIDLKLNYGTKFEEIDKTIKERLTSNKCGLFMFHGPPGTGKTTYIKYLAGQINRDFIYIPTTMIENFTSDPNCLNVLIQKSNSIIILEDAEKAIMKRQGDGLDSSAVSSLLNLSDGILGDILKTSVILTYNCPKQDIDTALRRKGRLQVDYEFGKLNVSDAKKLAKHIKLDKKTIENITDPMSVAEIYNLEKEVDLNEEKHEEKQERVIGFGRS